MELQNQANQPEKKERKYTGAQKIFKESKDYLIILILFMLVYILCFRVVIVVGDSMFDTLVDGDYLVLISNVFYTDPQYGDIIVASKESFDNGAPIVKRVIATEGQTVDIDFDQGVVNRQHHKRQEVIDHTQYDGRRGIDDFHCRQTDARQDGVDRTALF